ncbi:MAG: DUF2892 domain-containing protein [Chitinispirillaceae bacterium]|nr:DUF2892 domain-containing protein [Chitinispirillaceae bacterium]
MAEDAIKSDRVFQHTPSNVNEKIIRQIEMAVSYYSDHSDKIEPRLEELNKEWDIERLLETNASVLSLFGLILGIFGKRSWLMLPLFVIGFLLQHALKGWCPPLELFRRLGFRTKEEISRERNALKALRGDFNAISQIEKVPTDGKSTVVLQAMAG